MLVKEFITLSTQKYTLTKPTSTTKLCFGNEEIMADKITTASAAWLTDPTVFAVNRTPAHSNHVTFSHIPAIGEPSDLKQSLDGEWRVEMVQASDIDLEEEPFAAEDFDDSAFGRIDVPSHLQNA